jgi:hypothetical protein
MDLPPVQSRPPSLRRLKSGAQLSLCVLYGVTNALADIETQAKESSLTIMVTEACGYGASKVSWILSWYLLPLSGGGCPLIRLCLVSGFFFGLFGWVAEPWPCLGASAVAPRMQVG